MNKVHILMLCGFGDTLSAITRLPSFKEIYPKHKICFYLGGFGKSPEMSKQQLELEGYEAKIINNLQYHGQLPQIRDFLQKSVIKEGDIFEDWSFCEEIFNNQPATNWQYDMKIPYAYSNEANESEYFEEIHNEVVNHLGLKIVAIKCVTKSGNAEGFDHDIAAGRFWKEEEWKKLIDHLRLNGYVPMFVGKKDEDWGLIDYMRSVYHWDYEDWKRATAEEKERYIQPSWIDFSDKSIAETAYVLEKVDACVACNSWEWELTSRQLIPTFCFFTKNPFFIENHVPHNHEFYNTCYIQTDNNITGEQVFDIVNYMVKNKKRPEVPYSIAMITYRDEDTIEKTIKNINENSTSYDIHVITGDGERKDKTDYLVNLKLQNVTSHEKQWEHDFSIQKNYALNACKNKWKILLDADETLDTWTWGMLPWLLWKAEKEGVDCLSLSRINVLEGMNQQQLQEYCQRQGWQLNGYFSNWINFPDFQKRIFYGNDIKYVGQTHEQIVGFKKEKHLLNHSIYHFKSKERQEIGLKREHDQYKMKAEEVYKDIYE